MPLPKMGTPEWDREVEFYRNASREDRNKRAIELGMLPASYSKRMLERDIRISDSIAIPSIKAGGLDDLEQQVLNIVLSETVSVGELSRRIDRSAETIIKTIDRLRAKSYEVILDEASKQVSIPQEPSKEFKPTEFEYFRKYYRIGLVSDTHLGSKYQQLTLLYDAYAEFNKQNVDFVLHAGDLFEGVGVYSGQDIEVFLHDPFGDTHIDYAEKNYPVLERGRKTYIIGGQHDRSFWKHKGRNVIEALCKKRKDLVYRGFYKAEFTIKGLKIGLMHPGGGVAYARSYRMQKIVENMVGFVASIPSATAPILQIMGHWHIPCHLPSYMGIDVVSLPCFQSQTPYLEQKGLMPVVGYGIAEVWLDRNKNETKVLISFYNQNARIAKGDY